MNSDFFETHFKYENTDVVRLEELDATAFDAFLQWTYKGSVEVTRETLIKLPYLVDFLQVPRLQSEVQKVAINLLRQGREIFSKCWSDPRPGAWYTIADGYNMPAIQSEAQETALVTFEKLPLESLAEIPVDLLVELIKHDRLEVHNETVVVEALIKWTHANQINKYELLCHIRWPFIFRKRPILRCDFDKYLKDLGVMNEFCDLTNFEMWFNAYRHETNTPPRRKFPSLLPSLRYVKHDAEAYIHFDESTDGQFNFCSLDHLEAIWNQCKPQPDEFIFSSGRLSLGFCCRRDAELAFKTHRDRAFACLSDEVPLSMVSNHFRPRIGTSPQTLVIIGGMGEDRKLVERSESYEIYSMVRSTEVPTLSGARIDMCAVAIQNDQENDLVYVIGGTSAYLEAVSIVECFIYMRKKWKKQSTPQLPLPRTMAGCAAIGGVIYVVGGRQVGGRQADFRDAKATSSVLMLSPLSKAWEAARNMNEPREKCGVTTMDGCIYAVGGQNCEGYISTVEKYDPNSNEWTYVASLLYARSNVCAVVLDGELYAIGGSCRGENSRHVEKYNPIIDRWTEVQGLIEPRSGHTVVRIGNDQIYAVGGYSLRNRRNRRCDYVSGVPIERFDRITGTWEPVSVGNACNVYRSHHASIMMTM